MEKTQSRAIHKCVNFNVLRDASRNCSRKFQHHTRGLILAMFDSSSLKQCHLYPEEGKQDTSLWRLNAHCGDHLQCQHKVFTEENLEPVSKTKKPQCLTVQTVYLIQLISLLLF